MTLRHIGAFNDNAIGVSGQVARKVVAAPRPNRTPSPGTLEPVVMRAWFSMATTPTRMSLLQVIPFVIHGGTTQQKMSSV